MPQTTITHQDLPPVGLFNTQERYGAVAITFHWFFVLAFAGQLIIYLWMYNLLIWNRKWWFYDQHKSMGLTFFLAVVCRLAWCLLNPKPVMPPTMTRGQILAARLSHGYLFFGMLVMPISGFLGSKAGGSEANWWGIYESPDLFSENVTLNFWAETVHTWTFYSIAVVVLLHATAALIHNFKWGDPTLHRMLP
ncbi:MAG: cytochrome b [Pseudomonadota bacterium]